MSLATSDFDPPLLRRRLEERRRLARQVYEEVANRPLPPHVDPPILLSSYRLDAPQCFSDREVARSAFELFEQAACPTSGDLVARWLQSHSKRVDAGMEPLLHVSDAPDSRLPEDRIEQLALLATRAHPQYVNLADGTFVALAYPLAQHSRRARKKSAENLSLHSIREELLRGPLGAHLHCVDTVTRNAIAHCDVSYHFDEVHYRDRKQSKLVPLGHALRLVDDLHDLCNSLALALLCYWVNQNSLGRQANLPAPLLLLELRLRHRLPSWSIDTFLEQVILDNRKQSTIFAATSYLDPDAILLASITTVLSAKRFLPNYDRYFVWIRDAGRNRTSFVAFSGDKLRASPDTIAGGASAITERFIRSRTFLRRAPAFAKRAESYLEAARLYWRPDEVLLGGRQVRFRSGGGHRKGYYYFADVRVVIEGESREIRDFVRENYSAIVAAAALWMSSQEVQALALPIGHIHLHVFTRDYRIRRLERFGLGDDYLCLVVRKFLGQVRVVPPAGSDPERLDIIHTVHWNAAPFL